MRRERVIVGVDDTVESRAAVEWCARNLKAGSEVVAVAAMSKLAEFVLGLPGFDVDPAAHMLGRASTNWVAPLHSAGLPVRIRFEEDESWRAILSVAKDEHAGLVVVGKEHHRLLSKFFNPPDADLVVQHAPCPVVIVPTSVQANVPAAP